MSTLSVSNILGTSALNVSSSVSDGIGNIRDVPVDNKTTGYVLTVNDIGKLISITTGNVWVPNAVFSSGDNITVYNDSGSNQTINSNSSVTMYLVGTATTGNRTLSQRGLASIICVAANTFVITGGGLT
jgi:hypothetical protein